MKLGGLGLPNIVILMVDFRASAPEICDILREEHLCPIIVNLVPLLHLIPLDQWRHNNSGGDGRLQCCSASLLPTAGRSAMTILQSLPCSKNWKPYKIETKDIDTHALDPILALYVGC